MTKPYTWEEIKEFLIRELKKTKHIMTWGTIGSLNVEHDIDTIITKKPKSKTSDFYKEIHTVFDKLNLYLKKYNCKSVCFSTMLEEETLTYLKSYSKFDLGFHTMIYSSYPQIEIDWAGAQDTNIKELLLKDYLCLIGSPSDLFTNEFTKRKPYDATYNFLIYANKINSHYPSELYLSFMNKIFDYLFRKRLKLNIQIAKNEREVRNIFYKLCDEIDKLNIKRTKK